MILILSKDSLQIVLPTLLDDIHSQTTHFGREGKVNPFNEIYKVRLVSLKFEYRGV